MKRAKAARAHLDAPLVRQDACAQHAGRERVALLRARDEIAQVREQLVQGRARALIVAEAALERRHDTQ